MSPNHPWRSNVGSDKLKAARAEAKRIRDRKYRADNLEWKQLNERNWHRKKLGIPLDAPVMTRTEVAACAAAANRAKKRKVQ